MVSKMYKFHNMNASSIRTIMVASCLDDGSDSVSDQLAKSESFGESRKRKGTESCSVKDVRVTECSQSKAKRKPNTANKSNEKTASKETSPSLDELCASIEYNMQYRKAQSSKSDLSISSEEVEETMMSDSESEQSSHSVHSGSHDAVRQLTPGYNRPGYKPFGLHIDTSAVVDTTCDNSASSSTQESSSAQASSPLSSTSSLTPTFKDKYLIYTTGSQTYTPHQIGIKKITSSEARDLIYTLQHDDHSHVLPPTGGPVEAVNIEQVDREEDFDSADHLIELHGHIIGMSLSPDHR